MSSYFEEQNSIRRERKEFSKMSEVGVLEMSSLFSCLMISVLVSVHLNLLINQKLGEP